MAKPKKLVLIDGHAQAYRMFYALSVDSFSTRAGEPTNATFGFTRSLLDFITADQPPDYLAVSFDTGKTFRDDIFEAYKGTRAKMPDELALQIERIRQVVEAFNIPILEAEGYEADDVLGTIARLTEAQGVDVLIVTGDRDLLQLVTEKTQVQLPPRPKSGSRDPEIYDRQAVVDYFGVTPEQVVDYKAMVGDSSDNIPGVAGVGDKSATELLQQYGTLEAIFEQLDTIQNTRARNALAKGHDEALLSQKLARIVTDVPLDFDLEACRTHDYDRDKVAALFQELEFRQFVKRLPGATPAPAGQISMFGDDVMLAARGDEPPTKTIIVTTEEALGALVKRLEAASEIAFDTETTGVDQMSADLVGIALAVEQGEGYYVPVGHTSGQQLPLDLVLEKLRPALTNPKIAKYGHNAKYDYVMLARYGLPVSPLSFDSMIGGWLLNSDASQGKLGLKGMAFVRLGIEMTEISELLGTGRKQITMDAVPIADAAPYAAADADMTLRLSHGLQTELRETGFWDLFDQIERPLIPVLADMEMNGILLDPAYLEKMSGELGARLDELEKSIQGYTKEDFNLNSPQQLSEVLFVELGLPTEGLRKTATGFYSTAAGVLENLQGKHPIVDLILEYRELSKLKSTYLDTLPKLVNAQTGRVHTSYNAAGAVTGRLSSSDPNLQNIPIRTELGRKVRGAFVAPPGHVLMAADYSQVELRVLAHISQDPTLLEAFRAGVDIHANTAATVLGVALDDVSVEDRSFAKRVNFGLLYGMSAYRLSRETELTLSEAESYVRAYFDSMPTVEDYITQAKHKAATDGYVETLLGRRRYFPILQTTDTTRQASLGRASAEREAVNMPIQGTAADIIKLAMIQLHTRLKDSGLGARMLLQVHDELVLEVPQAEVEETTALVREVMERAYSLDAPLKVDVHSGPSWYSLK